jgi:carbon-monoxide dehydrogenase small subunit
MAIDGTMAATAIAYARTLAARERLITVSIIGTTRTSAALAFSLQATRTSAAGASTKQPHVPRSGPHRCSHPALETRAAKDGHYIEDCAPADERQARSWTEEAVALAHIALTVNGDPTEVAFEPYKTLLELLREDLNLCGTKHGCELGECGACAVLLDGEPVLSCLVLAVACGGRTVTTVEGLATDGRLDPLQDTFADLGAAQCGYCTPGFLVTARALLDANPHPTRDDIRDALSGNLCRCTGYQQIFEAVEAAIEKAGSRT